LKVNSNITLPDDQLWSAQIVKVHSQVMTRLIVVLTAKHAGVMSEANWSMMALSKYAK
jgi:hypothetical protein